MIIPINRKINSERMLKTGEFQTEHFHNDEMLWLVAYLRKIKKMDEKDVFIKWVPFYLKGSNITPEYARDSFKSFWRYSKNTNIKNKHDKIVLWREEVDYINSLPIPKSTKEYFVILLLHSRTSDKYIYDSLPFEDYHWYLSTNDHNYELMRAKLLEYSKKYNFVKEIELIEEHDMLDDIAEDGSPIAGGYIGEKITNIRLEVSSPVCKYGGEEGWTYLNILDGLSDIKHIIKNISICTECGCEFEFNPKSKKTICNNCWNKKEKERKNERLAISN